MNFIDKISEIEKLSFTRNDNDFDGVVVLPPPNITGKLHIGHALNAFIQDLRIRFEKLHGRNILWIPGTDHSGIATQKKIKKSIDFFIVKILKNFAFKRKILNFQRTII